MSAEPDQMAPTPDEHAKDLLVACPSRDCRAPAGKDCINTAPGIVHFGRRLQRLLKGYR